MRPILALVFLAALVVAGCQRGEAAAGIVTAVDSSSPVDVSSFTLRTPEGEELMFRVGRLQLDGGAFPANHLREHMATVQPVAVAYRVENGERVAYRLADAPWLDQ